MSPLAKARSLASRAYWKYQETRTAHFAVKIAMKQQQYATSEKRMGRTPLTTNELEERAKTEWLEALQEYRDLEKEEGVRAMSEQDVIDYKKKDRSGRLEKDDVLHLKKYIRRTERDLQEAKSAPVKKIVAMKFAGRPEMSKPEKIAHYEERLEDANLDLKALLSTKEEHALEYYKLFDLKNRRRELKRVTRDNSARTNVHKAAAEELLTLKPLIDDQDLAYKKSTLKAGVPYSRRSPVERANPNFKVILK